MWFTALGSSAQLLRPLFVRPGTWRVLAGAIAVGVAGALSLLLG